MPVIKLNIKKFRLIITIVLLLFIISVQFISNINFTKLANEEKQLDKAYQTINRVEVLKTSIASFESKIRGFVLTGNELFLDNNAINQAQSVQSLKDLYDIMPTPEEIRYREILEDLVNQKINFNQKILITYNKDNPKPAIDLINSGVGKKLTDSINMIADKIIAPEQSAINLRMTDDDDYVHKLKNGYNIGLILFLCIILTAYLIISKDISKKENLEKELREANQKVEKSALIKEQFMANMSHEIRTPMNAVLGYTKRLAKSPLNEEQKEYVHSLNTAGEGLLRIINDILDFSKIEEGMLQIEEADFNLQGLMHSVTTMLQIKASEKNTKLILNPLENVPEHLIGDPTRLTQILINLISNSIKFTNKGIIEVSATLNKDNLDDVKVQFSVKDTGIGIPADKLKAIFERFNQGSADTTRRYGGTGLGLSIVKNLVELMKGSITVSSEVKKGTVFTFVLPFKKGDQSLIHNFKLTETSNENKQLNLKVLVAEDNKFNQNLLILLLKDWEITFDLATNGAEVIEFFKSNKYDLILMDIQMPKMNGYEATQFIRHELKSDIPIIAMTAHAFAGEKEKCISLGMTDYLSKPLRENDLYEILSNNQPNQKTEKIVDLTYVREISYGKEEFVNEMISLFKKDVPKELTILDNAIKDNNFETIRQISHKLKSTIPFVGIDKLIENDLSEMEQLGERQIEIEKIKQLFDKVNNICNQAINELT